MVFFMIALSGCAIGKGVRKFSYNGEMIYEAKCNGMARSYSDCLEQASSTCEREGKKAKPLNNEEKQGLMTMNGQLVTLTNRSILFSCE